VSGASGIQVSRVYFPKQMCCSISSKIIAIIGSRKTHDPPELVHF
jgi:hypothetical protein